jgi:hypothetical protein
MEGEKKKRNRTFFQGSNYAPGEDALDHEHEKGASSFIL